MPVLLVRLIGGLALSVLGGCGIDSGGAQAPAPAASSSRSLLVVGPITANCANSEATPVRRSH